MIKIVVDCNNVCYREAFKLGDLSYNEKQTGIIFGFLREIYKLHKIYKTNSFIFCWDSKESIRKKQYPGYKSKRADKREFDISIYEQFDLLRTRILPKIGFNNNFIIEGLESDDLIAEVVLYTIPWPGRIAIVSSDTDLYQLLIDPKIWMYNLNTKREFTNVDFTNKYRINPEEWIQVKAIAGCTTDEVKGIKGVGELTAIKYIKRELNKKCKAYKAIMEGEDIIHKNMQMVKLPHSDITKFPRIELKKDKLSIDGFIGVCQTFGFKSFMEEGSLNKWKELLKN